MTVRTQSWIWDRSTAGGADKLVQLALANQGGYGDDPTVAILPPSHVMIENLASACVMHPDDLWESLVRLRDSGEIDLGYEVSRTVVIFTAMRSSGSRVTP